MSAWGVLTLVSGGAWTWLAWARGGFWRAEPVLPPAAGGGADGTAAGLRVTVVIPARNEAESIEAAVGSLLGQQFAGELRVVVVDDNSSDGTGERVGAMAARDGRLRGVQGSPLEPGWTGKMWAVAQGLEQPEAVAADFVLLTDADVVHGPGHVAELVDWAECEGLDLVSEMVRLRCESLAERATVPAFVFFFAMLYPFRWVGDPRRKTAAAAGGTMLVRQGALRRIDGVNRIRGELIDDVALAREVKRGGHRIWLGHATEARSERRYPGFGDVWEMVARTAFVQLGYSGWALAGTVAGMLVLYGVPVVAAVAANGWPRWVGVGCWLGMAGLFRPTLRSYGRCWAWGLALPGIAMFYAAATVGSAMRFYRGSGGRWKDRTYAEPRG